MAATTISEEVCTLVEMWRAHPLLYNPNLKAYKSKDKKDAMHEKIGNVLRITGGDVRVRRDEGVIKITTKEEPPYLTTKSSGSGNARFDGFIPELMTQIATRAKLKYEFSLVKDGLYGMAMGERDWNGMIGEVLRKEAHLAAAPITISEERKKVVSFTEPFMNISTTILVKRPAEGEPKPFSTVQQLANQNSIQYGLIKNGQTQSFFRSSSDPTYQKMWSHMQTNQDLLQSEVPKGVKRVRNSNGKYAFIIESSTADYWITQYPCELMKIGNLGNNQGYGFVAFQNSPLLAKINSALKALKSNGELQKLKDKWWQTGKECQNGASTIASSILGLIVSFLFVKLF